MLMDVSVTAMELLQCRYGLSADIYSFGITIIEAALGHTPYVDMSFEQIAMKKAVNAGKPMLAVNTHGRHFSQVSISQRPELSSDLSSLAAASQSGWNAKAKPYASMQQVHCLSRAGTISRLSITLPLNSLLQAVCGLKQDVMWHMMAHDGSLPHDLLLNASGIWGCSRAVCAALP